jgi:hypothetical protein
MVIITKWFDCTTTLKHIHGIAMETNPIARALMYRFGIKGTVWFAFVVSIVVDCAESTLCAGVDPALSMGCGLCNHGLIYGSYSRGDGFE